jgi:hypothetical protein
LNLLLASLVLCVAVWGNVSFLCRGVTFCVKLTGCGGFVPEATTASQLLILRVAQSQSEFYIFYANIHVLLFVHLNLKSF